jgi:hypothetical protein
MIFVIVRCFCQLGILLCVKRRNRMMRIGVGSMGGMVLTDKLVFGRLEVLGVCSLDSATPVTSAYPAHASGSPSRRETNY